MTALGDTPKQRFLVLHDYGMGSSWWWVQAESERQIRETFAEVEIVDSSLAGSVGGGDLDEVDIDAPTMPSGLDSLRAHRDGQRSRPGFGMLADRSIAYVRRRWNDEGTSTTYLLEVGNDGRRLRQVELAQDGAAVKSTPDDWSFNPPVVDLFDPELVDMEITAAEFEAAWQRACHEKSDL